MRKYLKKKAHEKGTLAEVTDNKTLYKGYGEVGRFEFITHIASLNGQVQYNTACDLFSPLKGKEFYRTIGFKELTLIYGDTESSYRKMTKNLILSLLLKSPGNFDRTGR